MTRPSYETKKIPCESTALFDKSDTEGAARESRIKRRARVDIHNRLYNRPILWGNRACQTILESSWIKVRDLYRSSVQMSRSVLPDWLVWLQSDDRSRPLVDLRRVFRRRINLGIARVPAPLDGEVNQRYYGRLVRSDAFEFCIFCIAKL